MSKEWDIWGAYASYRTPYDRWYLNQEGENKMPSNEYNKALHKYTQASDAYFRARKAYNDDMAAYSQYRAAYEDYKTALNELEGVLDLEEPLWCERKRGNE